MFEMSPQMRERWRQERTRGRSHFLWHRCVLSYGICILTPLNLLVQYVIYRTSLTGFEATPEFDWGTHLILSVIGGPIGGCAAGFLLWRIHEADYLRGEQTDAA